MRCNDRATRGPVRVCWPLMQRVRSYDEIAVDSSQTLFRRGKPGAVRGGRFPVRRARQLRRHDLCAADDLCADDLRARDDFIDSRLYAGHHEFAGHHQCVHPDDHEFAGHHQCDQGLYAGHDQLSGHHQRAADDLRAPNHQFTTGLSVLPAGHDQCPVWNLFSGDDLGPPHDLGPHDNVVAGNHLRPGDHLGPHLHAVLSC